MRETLWLGGSVRWRLSATGAERFPRTRKQPSRFPDSAAAPTDDPYLWLEKTHGTRAMQWVHAQNARTEKRFADNAQFDQTRERILEVLDSDARIPSVTRMGGYLYNFWKDKEHPRGIWRRTTLAEYRKADPKWQVLLDIDALGKAEGRTWVFKGAQCMKPDYRRCLVSLSPDGGDAVRSARIRPPDPIASSRTASAAGGQDQTGWIDHDHIYVGTDFGPGSMTTSSYPRIVKEWTRGTPLSEATTVFAGKPTRPGGLRPPRPHAGFRARFRLRGQGLLPQRDVPAQGRQADPHRRAQRRRRQRPPPMAAGGDQARRGRWAARPGQPAPCWPPTTTTSWPASAISRRCSRPTRTPRCRPISWTRHHLILDGSRTCRAGWRC